MAGYEFYGQAELPQQAKHNAAVQVRTLKPPRECFVSISIVSFQALPIVRNLPDPTGEKSATVSFCFDSEEFVQDQPP